jgi:hypothetical protein
MPTISVKKYKKKNGKAGAMKAYTGSAVTAPLILNLGII